MIRFSKALGTKNSYKKSAAQKAQRNWIFSVAHLYPWRVAPQQSSFPFPDGISKIFAHLYIYNLS